MKSSAIRWFAFLTVLGSIVLYNGSDAQAAISQTFTLHPGWNAVFVEVQPEPSDPATVFAGLPIRSVWTWLGKDTVVEFITNPDEGLWGQPGWCAYFADPKEAFLTNLFAILGNQAYLIRVDGSEDVDWTVTGQPSTRKIKWIADSFNLLGYHIDPDAPPTFEAFFSPSDAHAGQAAYRLNTQGEWEFIEDLSADKMAFGQAYWVYCEGSSTYQGPLDVIMPNYDGINYGSSLNEHTLALRNLSGSDRAVVLTLSSTDVALAYRDYDASSGYFVWSPLEDMPSVDLSAGQQAIVKLAVRRELLPAGVSNTTLIVSDDQGTRIRIPVSVEQAGN